jgi:hypothetical protein
MALNASPLPREVVSQHPRNRSNFDAIKALLTASHEALQRQDWVALGDLLHCDHAFVERHTRGTSSFVAGVDAKVLMLLASGMLTRRRRRDEDADADEMSDGGGEDYATTTGNDLWVRRGGCRILWTILDCV